jgi:hypothetical protein
VLTPVLVLLLVVAIPVNVTGFGDTSLFNGRYYDEEQRILETAPSVPFARDVSRDVRPIPDVFHSKTLTIGFLLDAKRSGRLEAPSRPIPEAQVNEMRVRLGVAQRERSVQPTCAARAKPLRIRPDKGTTFAFDTAVMISTVDRSGRPTSPPVSFAPTNGQVLTVELPDLALRVAPMPGAGRFRICEV